MKWLWFVLFSWAILCNLEGYAQTFEHYFSDSTLRVDYIFSGGRGVIQVVSEEQHLLDGWYGRRKHLDSLALQGNGQLLMRDASTGQVIYRTSFSSLFQEWLLTEEAQQRSRAYENVFLLPFPKKQVQIELSLLDIEGEPIAQDSYVLDPQDILIRRYNNHKPLSTRILHQGGDRRSCIDVAILAEGYTEEELPLFLEDAQKAVQAILRHEPFRSYQDRFNFIAVLSPSYHSGVSVPRDGDWKDTSFGSHFDTFYSDRYLTSRRIKDMHRALVGVPYEHIIILANSDVYGGGGIYNAYTLTSTHHTLYEPVVVHEFGHSFGGLADEYFYDGDVMEDSYSTKVEPWEQNITNLVDFSGKKWSSLLPSKAIIPTPVEHRNNVPIGLYEGAGYSSKGFYRCSYDCRMRTNSTSDFCVACSLALIKLIEFYTH